MRRRRNSVRALVLASMLGAASAAEAGIGLAPGQPLDRAAAQALLAPVLADAAAAEAVRVTIRQPALPLANPYAEEAILSVARARLTALDGFTATVHVKVGAHGPLALELSGEIERLVLVPVLDVAVPAGGRLDDASFRTLALPVGRVRGSWVRTAATFAGKEALRPLLAGQPIDRDAIGSPRLVRRGEPVKIVFVARGLTLEATGTARQDGGADAIVEVRNDRSGAIVAGRVTGPGRIRVETAR